MADGYAKARGISAIAIENYDGKALDIITRSCRESTAQVIIFAKTDGCPDVLEKLFRQHTAGWTELSDPALAAKKIDRVLDLCMFYNQPVCIELPQDVVDLYIPKHSYRPTEFEVSDPDTLNEVMLELENLFRKSRYPLIHLGREAIGQKVEHILLHFAERWRVPVTSSYLAKSYLLETHPNYSGSLSEELSLRSDLFCVIGNETVPYHHKGSAIRLHGQMVQIDEKSYHQIFLRDVLVELASLPTHRRPKLWYSRKLPNSVQDNCFITCRDEQLLEDISPYFSGDCYTSSLASPHYSLASAIGAAKAQPFKRPIVILDENDLRASLSELYIAHEECLPLLICVVGNGTWVKSLFKDIEVFRRKIPDDLPPELVVISLE